MDFKERRKIARLRARGRVDTLQRMLDDKAKAKAKGKEIRVEDPLKAMNRERQRIINKQVRRGPLKAVVGLRRGPVFEIPWMADFIPKEDDSPRGKFLAGLKRRGFQYIGSGHYSQVYGKPGSDRVIKVTRTSDGWIDYIQWAAKKGYCGSLAPRVYSYKKIKDFEVAVVERLDKTVTNLDNQHDFRFADKLAKLHTLGNTMAGVFLEELIPGMPYFLSQLVKEFGSNRNITMDLHSGNFMLRKDGSYCVTDPICGNCQSTTKRLKAKDFTSLAPAKRVYLFACSN